MSESAAAVRSADQRTFARDWKAWHLTREAQLGEPFGWLSITALHWLTEAFEKYDGVPGTWASRATGVEVRLDEGEELFIDNDQVHGGYRFDPLAERQSVTVRTADFAVEVARRGGLDLLRPRHSDATALAHFSGVPTYQPDQRWQLTGHFTADAHHVTVGSVVEKVRHHYNSPGSVSFDWEGRSHTLTAFPGKEAGSLQVLFTDATTGAGSSALCRALFLPAPEEDGTVLVDFNRAVNVPCSFTPYATCPLPPSENRLPFAVEAGEKDYRP